MNITCGTCGGFIGDFTYLGTGVAVICNCNNMKESICMLHGKTICKKCQKDGIWTFEEEKEITLKEHMSKAGKASWKKLSKKQRSARARHAGSHKWKKKISTEE